MTATAKSADQLRADQEAAAVRQRQEQDALQAAQATLAQRRKLKKLARHDRGVARLVTSHEKLTKSHGEWESAAATATATAGRLHEENLGLRAGLATASNRADQQARSIAGLAGDLEAARNDLTAARTALSALTTELAEVRKQLEAAPKPKK
jgi:chromosome segregation ATPase